MAETYSSILSGMMNAFASIISNNCKYCHEIFNFDYNHSFIPNDGVLAFME